MTRRELLLGKAMHVKHGFAFKGEHFTSDGKYMVLTPGNFLEGGGFREREGKERFYDGEFPNAYLLEQSDLIIAMTEQGEGLLGSTARVPANDRYLHNQRLGLVDRLDERLLNKRFVYWLLNTGTVRAQLRGSATGTKVRHTAPERIYKVLVSVPSSVEMQAEIAAVLDSFDDLIETNRRRIALLEESARLLYREWFVDLRFPGHELVKRINGLPVGWALQNLYDVADLKMGYPFKSELFNTEKIGRAAIRIRDVPTATPSTWTPEDPGSTDYAVERGDFLIGMDGFFHMNHWVGEPAWLVQRVCRIRPKDSLYAAYLALAMQQPIKHFEATISGATVAHLGAKHLKSIELLVPPIDLGESLSMLNDLLQQKLNLAELNARLIAARDALLPQLMSGELAV